MCDHDDDDVVLPEQTDQCVCDHDDDDVVLPEQTDQCVCVCDHDDDDVVLPEQTDRCVCVCVSNLAGRWLSPARPGRCLCRNTRRPLPIHCVLHTSFC